MRGWPAVILAVIGLGSAAEPVAAEGRDVARLVIFPRAVRLENRDDRQSILIVARHADGRTRDVTREATIRLTPPGVAAIDARVLRPVGNGRARLIATLGEVSAVTTVTVQHADRVPAIRFRRDVMPVFMRAGCNTGSCHGAARGKDGFRLSLFGYDPDGDYHRLTRELSGRRINLARPEESLILEKALGKVSHTGGRRFEEKSREHRILLGWLEAGAPRDPPRSPTLVRVEITPKALVLEGPGDRQPLLVTARYSDGTDRDVTSMALFLSSNDHTARVGEDGVVTAGGRGEAFVMARYGAHTVGTEVIVLPRGLAFRFPDEPESHYIDRLVNAKLRKLRIAPSPICGDAMFVRRAYLDLIGRLPTPAECRAFLASPRAEKRTALIDRLLERPEFAELWVLEWAELLQIRSSVQVSYKAMLLYHDWLEERIAANVPMDRVVKELLSANGGTFQNPATNYFQIERDTLKVAENVAQVFLGMRIQCAQCHNHPFDRWTQQDYYGFGAFFAQVGRKPAEDPRERIVFDRGAGEVRHPVTRRPVAPKFLGGERPKTRGRDRRAVVAEWLVSPENPYFARNLANRVWAHFFGAGIVDPVDDVRVSNPPSNPALLDALARRFIAVRYDFKKLVREICTSRAYQRSSVPNASNRSDTRNFARAAVRRIKAEVLLDCISQVTGTSEKFKGLPRGARAVQIADGAYTTHFLTIFGRPKRETVCTCEVQLEPNLSQALHLINGETVHRNILRGRRIATWLKEGWKPRRVVNELYTLCFSRPPGAEEWSAIEKKLAGAKDQRKFLEDLFWALLNSKEFGFNH